MELRFNLDELEEAARIFIENIRDNTIFAFEGEMGAGKTTFISEVCRQLGADDDFGSPTFNIINEYRGSVGNPIYHFDFYRLENEDEALSIGVEDYFYSGNLCLMEWPGKIKGILPEETVSVNICVNADGSRSVRF